MISDKKYTVKEFQDAIPGFAQALVNKCAEKTPDVKINVTQENPVSYLITIENGHKEEYYSVALGNDGLVESHSVYKI